MAAVSNSVVHLTMRFNETVLSVGTGVIYHTDNQYFIVTAWHNLSGLHSETLNNLSKKGGRPNNVVVSIAVSYSKLGVIRQSVTLPLTDEEKSLYYIHPKNWPRIDVGVIPFDPSAEHTSELYLSTGETKKVRMCLLTPMADGTKAEICPVQKYFVPDENLINRWLETVEVTEELFIPGYPHNIHDYYSQPVWKRATIASSVRLGWNREPKFLVDSASKSGMSGSPVLYYSPSGTVKILGSSYMFGQDVAILAGIYVGRLGVEGDTDPQVGTVWKQSVIDEIIQAKCFERLPEEIELSNSELLDSARLALGSCSHKGLENVMNSDLPSRYYVRHQLLTKISGRASPERALQAIIEAATTYDGPLVPDEAE